MRALLLALLLVPQFAAAETYDIGARVGGYGFRREGDTSNEGWTECRMDGVGVFASRAVRGPLFVEVGLDAYTTSQDGLPTDLPISRMSGLATVAGGARASFTSWLRGYVQVGGGMELTRVSVPYGEDDTIRDTKVMPTGFIGLGVDLKLGGKTYVGMNIRTLMMGNFNYQRGELEMTEAWGFTKPGADQVFDASLDFAAQAQFFVRRDL